MHYSKLNTFIRLGGGVEISDELMIYEWLVHKKKITYDIFFFAKQKIRLF